MVNTLKKVKVFGAALDPIDSPVKVLAKCAYLNRLAQNLIDPRDRFLDPYEGLLKYSKVLSDDKFIKAGKFQIESWLTPKPNIEDFPKLAPINFQRFVNSGAVEKYSEDLEGFVKEMILPDIPLMIGVDHSLTGGVLRALSKEYNPKDILVIIFDAHFDAISASISLNLAKYSKEHQDEIFALMDSDFIDDGSSIEIADSYSCASFLAYLLEKEIIIPENLIIFGCQDYPSKELRSRNDPRVKDYIDLYDSFESKGVKFIPVSENTLEMTEKLESILKQVSRPYIYVSFDVDVGVFKEILAARFTNVVGIDKETILDATRAIRSHIDSKKCTLVGLDVMEIETQVLGKELKRSKRRDETPEVVDGFLKILLDF